MTAQYRLVHFVPDPFLGGRVPIAALLRTPDGVQVVRVPHLPGPHCLGGRARAATVQLVVEDLEAVADRRFDALPASVGPQILLGDHAHVPAGADDPAKWLALLLDGASPPAARDAPTTHHAPRRSSIGYQWLTNYKVASYVKKTFEPGRDLDGFLSNASALGAVTHYVPGKREVLLMEPLIPTRPQWQDDVREVARTFGAYKTAVKSGGKLPLAPRFVVYVLEGGKGKQLDAIDADLSSFADEIVNVTAKQVRRDFLDRVREVGATFNQGEMLG